MIFVSQNIDLHALTGWIPERVAIHPQDGTGTFEKDKVFDMIKGRMEQGHVLVTVATGQMDESEADRAGLVTCHAYAVLDLQVVKVLQQIYRQELNLKLYKL